VEELREYARDQLPPIVVDIFEGSRFIVAGREFEVASGIVIPVRA